jgi:uncharacterized membrane protein YheB (UPF0754 family)
MDRMTYNENMNYKKLLNKELREHKRRTRQQIIIDNFMKQLQDSVNEWGIIEVPVLCQWGIISGESRLKLVKDKPIDVNELLSPETCKKYGWKWLDIPNKEDYYRLRIELGLIRNPVRNEILQYAKYLEGQGIKPENMVKTLHEKLKGRLTERTIRNYLPKELKRSYSNSERLSELMFTKEPMVTLCFRLPKGLKIDYQNKFKENIGLYLRFFMKFHLEHPELISEDKLHQYFIEHQSEEVKELINNSKQLVQQHPVEVEHKVKEDYCGICGKFTRFEWDSFNQQFICVECKNRELGKVKQTPAKVEVRQVVK